MLAILLAPIAFILFLIFLFDFSRLMLWMLPALLPLILILLWVQLA